MSGQRCDACDGFTGECDKCGFSDWCLHWKEGPDGEDISKYCRCSGDYTLRDFVKERDRDPYPHYDTQKEIDA